MEIYLDCAMGENEHAVDGLFDNIDHVQDTKEDDDAPNGEVETESRKETSTSKKRKRNGAQFNEKHLCSKSGLSALAQVFENVGFKGANEEEKLNQLLKQFEHWAHQMYPRYPFEDVIEKVEELGAKKIVKAHAHSVKLGHGSSFDITDNRGEEDNILSHVAVNHLPPE